MAFYDGLQTVAANLLRSKGQNLTFNRKTVSSSNAATGVVTSTPSTYTGYGVALNYKKKEIDGTVIQAGDIRLIFAKTTTAPINGDTVTIDSIILRLMNLKPTSPAGTVVIYEASLRK